MDYGVDGLRLASSIVLISLIVLHHASNFIIDASLFKAYGKISARNQGESMNRFVKLEVGAALLVLTLLGSLGTAHAVSPPATPTPGSTLAQRVDQRKAEQGTTLTDQDRQRLTSTCAGAQSKLRLIQNDAVERLENHSNIYKKIDGRLWVAIGQLKLATQDTFQLEKQRQTLTDKTTGFESIAGNYKQALDDTLVINCQADLVGFKALLDTTRVYYGQLRAQSTDVRDYVINTIKPTLVGHVADLQTKPASGGGN